MSVTAQAIYKDTWIKGFETTQSILRQAVTTDTESRGGSVYFLVVTTGGAVAVTRGSNGLIPPTNDSQTQVPITFEEAHHKLVRNGFDIFRAQGNQLAIMRSQGTTVINRAIDKKIMTTLATGTVTLGDIGTLDMTDINRATTILRNAHVGNNSAGSIYALVTPAEWNYLEDMTGFSNSLYSATGGKLEEGVPIMNRWVYFKGVWWAVHEDLPGVGTATASSFMWHKEAIGHAIAEGTVKADIGMIPGEDQSYALHTIYHGAAKLQNAGIVKWTHDDTAYSS